MDSIYYLLGVNMEEMNKTNKLKIKQNQVVSILIVCVALYIMPPRYFSFDDFRNFFLTMSGFCLIGLAVLIWEWPKYHNRKEDK